MTRNDQLRHQAARNKALAEEYGLAGDAESYDFWMRAAGWLLAEVREETISGHQAPMGNAAGLSPWLDKCPSRNCIKAAYSFFRRLWLRSQRAWTRRNRYEKKAESKALATKSAMVSVMTIARGVSNLNGGGLCA